MSTLEIKIVYIYMHRKKMGQRIVKFKENIKLLEIYLEKYEAIFCI